MYADMFLSCLPGARPVSVAAAQRAIKRLMAIPPAQDGPGGIFVEWATAHDPPDRSRCVLRPKLNPRGCR